MVKEESLQLHPWTLAIFADVASPPATPNGDVWSTGMGLQVMWCVGLDWSPRCKDFVKFRRATSSTVSS